MKSISLFLLATITFIAPLFSQRPVGDYQVTIHVADSVFAKKEYLRAQHLYNESLKLRPESRHATKQLKAVEKQLRSEAPLCYATWKQARHAHEQGNYAYAKQQYEMAMNNCKALEHRFLKEQIELLEQLLTK